MSGIVINPYSVGFANVYSVDFDGSDDYVNLGDSSTFSFGDGSTDSAFSVSLWINPDDVSSNQGILCKIDSSDQEWFVKFKSNYVWLRLFDDSTGGAIGVKSSSTTFSTGTWYHIVGTYDGGSDKAGMNMYVNGSVENARTSSGSYTAMENLGADLRIGVQENTSQYFDGNVDEISLWSKELSSGEVSTLYNSGSPTDLTGESGLIGWWRMGEGATYPTIPDDSTNSNNGTMTNMVSGDIVEVVP